MRAKSAAPGELAALQAGKIINGNAENHTTTDPRADREQIRRALEVLRPGGVVELRALFQRGRKRTAAGYFDAAHRQELVEAAAKLNEQGAAVYVALNSLDPQMLGRYANRVEDYAQAAATDANVTRRDWLLLDFDAQRPKDTSATAEQCEAAKACARATFSHLKESGWPAPVMAESGNGVHLLYRIDLPNDDAARDLVKGCLAALAERFDDDAVKVDRSVFNAARIVKLYGTVANKGDHLPSTPWRCARIRHIPASLEVVPRELLEALAAEVRVSERPRLNGHARLHSGDGRAWTESDVSAFLARGGIEVMGEPAPHDGSLRWRLKRCPFNSDHGPTESAVFLQPSGALGFKCSHNGCADRHWSDLRELVDGPREGRKLLNGTPWEQPKPTNGASVGSVPGSISPKCSSAKGLRFSARCMEHPSSGACSPNCGMSSPSV